MYGIINKSFEIIAVSAFYSFMFFFPFLILFFNIYILFSPPLWPLAAMYLLWMYYDRDTPKKNGRRSRKLMKSSIWKYFRNYYPHKLVKTADLPSNKNYILCVFPHGMICSAVFANFFSTTSGFYKLYPNFRVTGHTLNLNFFLPIHREIVMATGLISASEETLNYCLNKKGGNIVTLVIGGAAEALINVPGQYRIVLKNRKGFVRVALQNGTSLVPVFCFGENDVYDQYSFPENSWMYRLQIILRRWTGVSLCILKGRGIFGLLPNKTPVTTVVGKPIDIPKIENPTKEEIDEYHSRFIDEITLLFETHKSKYVKNPESTFLSIENAPY